MPTCFKFAVLHALNLAARSYVPVLMCSWSKTASGEDLSAISSQKQETRKAWYEAQNSITVHVWKWVVTRTLWIIPSLFQTIPTSSFVLLMISDQKQDKDHTSLFCMFSSSLQKNSEICTYSYPDTILSVKLNRQVLLCGNIYCGYFFYTDV